MPYRRELRLSAGWLAILALAWIAPATIAQPSQERTADDEYLSHIESLGERAEPEDVDARRLAKFFFSQAATLDGGKTNVMLLRNAIAVRNRSDDSVRRMIEGEYGSYDEAILRFRGSASALLDRASDRQRLYRASMDGLEACWRLSGYVRIAETYGAQAIDFVSVLASTEACSRFRRVAFHPAVQALIVGELDAAADRRMEIDTLETELRELETLIEDLRTIDER